MNKKRIGFMFLKLLATVLILFVLFLGYKWFTIGYQVKKNFVDNLKKSKTDSIKYERILRYKIVSVQTGDTLTINQKTKGLTFVSFWFIGCGGCVQEFPSIEKFKDKVGDKVNFLIVSRDSPSAIKDFLATNKVDLPFYSIVEAGYYETDIHMFPTSIMFNNGKESFSLDGFGYYDSFMFYDFLKENNPSLYDEVSIF
jgi:thiol-disulfide isomerase/thioredoxin